MRNLPEKLQKKLIERRRINALRSLPEVNGGTDFASNDYLGIGHSRTVFDNAIRILSEKEISINGASGSRLLTGNSSLYNEVEELIRKFHKVDSALVFNSGYDANIGLFSSVPQRDDIILYDEYIHASIRDGIAMSKARNFKYRHNDLDDLLSRIKRVRQTGDIGTTEQIYIATESVFSMDGDAPDLKAMASICQEFNLNLIVDEAHAIGLFGKNGLGNVQEQDLEENIFARTITFGKALGCHGAAILGGSDLKKYLINYARSFIYTTGMSPHNLATIMAAYQFMTGSDGNRERKILHKNIEYFNHEKERLGISSFFIPSISAIHSCIIGDNNQVIQVAENIQKSTFDVRPILSPTVQKGKERLRFCLHSYNSKEDITNVLQLLQIAIKKHEK
ncbi:aminotransferase class I/II-fold pyridoxal phosphate-dependent enzyme [uncultured Eudoraea sp.]|uniref:aminotransferase class I/II-fold pyridoxal phosphate-dependent enzyme n=1 Tax=uncultured Eudoraea sp. TaxID=1035614 RepID=UPI002612CF2E|nr:aminotransferase class I/II-fold pyridoxal phosphate-dependent enzyme [uncultured Eudoraea sp.]